MALKVANTEVIGDDRNTTFTTNQTLSRDANTQVSGTAQLTGAGYSIGGNKVVTSTGKQFNCAVFDNSTCLVTQFPFAPVQGTISGYASGGTSPPSRDTIDKFPFSSDTNATDVAELAFCRSDTTAGQSSSVSGYLTGGRTCGTCPATSDSIEKFSFASDTNGTDIAEMTQDRRLAAGQSSSVSGYTTAGSEQGSPFSNTIDKFPFSSDSPASDVGELTQSRFEVAGQSSTINGYTSGGTNPPKLDTVDKFPFAADAPATDVGELSVERGEGSGQSSGDFGYTSGGSSPAPFAQTIIDKFPFAADAPATDVGDLSGAAIRTSGQSSRVNGYASGGPGGGCIVKFPFASDTNGASIGTLTQQRDYAAGQQSGGNA